MLGRNGHLHFPTNITVTSNSISEAHVHPPSSAISIQIRVIHPSPLLLLLGLQWWRLMDRLNGCVLLTEAVIVVAHVLRVVGHRLGLGKGSMLLLIRLFLVRLLVESRLHRVLRMVLPVLLLMRLAGVR